MKNKMFYGWWIIVIGSIINGIGAGILYHSFTVFFLPLKRDFGVSSAAISLLYGAARLEGGVEGPVVGYLIDRFGSRVMIGVGASMAGIGLILLSITHSFWPFFFIYVFIVTLGYNAGFFHPLTAAVNNWFIRHRGVGFGWITASGSIGGMVMAPLLSYIILNLGWRFGTAAAGLLILIIALPASRRIYQSPESVGLRPDGDPLPENEPERSNRIDIDAVQTDFSVREALGTTAYWMLLFAITTRLFVTVALNTHLVPILVWKGISESRSAYLVSLYAFTGIFTMLGAGWIGDRWSKPLLCVLCTVPNILVMTGLAFTHSTIAAYMLPVALAITMGVAPLGWSLIGDFFGRRAYATLRGIMGIGYGAATFVSPIYAGWVFDHTGSYVWVLITFSIILLFAAISFAILRKPSPGALKGAPL